MLSDHWQCPRCGHEYYEVDEIRTTGNGFSRFLDIQNRKFSAVTCKKCTYTELYKAETSQLENVFDFLTT